MTYFNNEQTEAVRQVVTQTVTTALKNQLKVQLKDLKLKDMVGTLEAVGQRVNEFDSADTSTIKTFNGHNQIPKKWINKALAFATFKGYDLERTKAFLGLMVEGSAALWFTQEKVIDMNTQDQIKESFLARYVVTNSWLEEQKLYTLKQDLNEPVHFYHDRLVVL